jgi:hypothetical protein
MTALVAVACGSVNQTGIRAGVASGARASDAQATPPSGAGFEGCIPVQPEPVFQASSRSIRNLEIISFKGSQNLVVRDITDFLHPTTVSTLENLWNVQFVSATELSFWDGTQLVRAPLSGSPRGVVAELTPSCSAPAFAWNHDGTEAAYVTGTELHLVGRGRNRIINIRPGIPSLDCMYCEDIFDMRLLYSPNGEYISLVQNWGRSVLRIWTSDGKLVQSLDNKNLGVRAGSPTMSVWSSNTFYFRDEKGVQVWRDGVQSLLLPGVAWIRPKASPGGGQIVYGLRDSSGRPNVYLYNTNSGEVREIAKSRAQPAFLNAHLIWYREERPCAPGDEYPCPTGPTYPSGRTFVYDLLDNTEIESAISAVFDVWPHPA